MGPALVLIALLFTSSSFAAPARNQCPTQPLNPAHLNAAGVRAYLANQGSKIKNVGDLICCLPENARTHYLIGHTSLSAQKANFHSPRILITNRNEDDSRGVNFILTVTSGDPGLANSAHAELLTYDDQRGRVSLVDIEPTKNGLRASGTNPPDCMSCHGDRTGTAGAAGPRPIFDPFENWNHFVGGRPSLCEGESADYMRTVEETAVASFTRNPSFRCLPPARGQDFFGTFRHVDASLNMMNRRRTATIWELSPDYSKLKYAIIGAGYCTNSVPIESFIPRNQIDAFSNQSTIAPEIRRSTNLRSLCMELSRRDTLSNRQVGRAQRADLPLIRAGKNPDFKFANQVGCNQGGQVMPTAELCDRIWTPGTPIRAANRFALDSLRRSSSGSSSEGDFRFLFEGRGIDTSNWHMAAEADRYGKDLGEGVELLIDRLKPTDAVVQRFSRGLERDVARACQQLARDSVAHLTANPLRRPAAAPTTARPTSN